MTNWHGSGTVLVIDDEEGVRIVAQSALERAGFSVITAEDGPSGIEIFRARCSEIVLVLLDLTMPRMSGSEVYRAIIDIHPGARVLLSSGYFDDDANDLLDAAGVAGFIQKPYRPAKLIEKMRAALEVDSAAGA